MAGLEKNRGRMKWKELAENVEKFCICVTQGIRNRRPVFARKVTPKCIRDHLGPEDGLWPQVCLSPQPGPGAGTYCRTQLIALHGHFCV